jgi:hypothetical protein
MAGGIQVRLPEISAHARAATTLVKKTATSKKRTTPIGGRKIHREEFHVWKISVVRGSGCGIRPGGSV